MLSLNNNDDKDECFEIELIKAISKQTNYVQSPKDIKKIEEYKTLRASSEEEVKSIIFQLIDHYTEVILKKAKLTTHKLYDGKKYLSYASNIAAAIIAGLMERKLNFSEEEWIKLFDKYEYLISERKKIPGGFFSICSLPINDSIKQIEYHLENNPKSSTLVNYINSTLQWKIYIDEETRCYYSNDLKKAESKLKLLIKEDNGTIVFGLNTNDIGTALDEIIRDIKIREIDIYDILHLASDISGSKPDAKFVQALNQKLDLVGLEKYRKIVHKLLKLPLTQQYYTFIHKSEWQGQIHEYSEIVFLAEENRNFIKGLVWTCNRFSDKETISILIQLAEKCYNKIPGKGPAAAAIGNACVYILGNMKGKDGLGALSRFKLKVRQNNVKKTIDNLLFTGAEKYNISVEELKEMAVPDFGLVSGSKSIIFEEYTLAIDVNGPKVTNSWLKSDGSKIKSVPSIVKKTPSLTKRLKEVRKELKELQKVYSAQKQRIDNQFILDRKWDYLTFKKYYLNHGLVYPITSKLIWSFTSAYKNCSAILINGEWKTNNDKVIDWIDDTTIVSLWHPIHEDETTISSWRQKILEQELKQPIKQAYREIYLLTDAEINTRIYSNRMAAHILKQHQFNSLASIRNWKYSLIGAYDDGIHSQVCSKYLQKQKLTVEFWIDEIVEDDAFNEAGIWHYVATDQVKFKDQHGDTINLVNIPKIVFTEVMRDVDLFVGVSSVGNDPQWIDNNGERQANRDYWQSYSFGDLSEIAKTRKEILARLLPRLKKIRDIARIEGKFLIVKGKIRNYKIHIGSGNILMEPNDQYLCIVPSWSAKTTQNLFIPFEGDRGLSIVLSKALLLASDDKIEDPLIISQIGRK